MLISPPLNGHPFPVSLLKWSTFQLISQGVTLISWRNFKISLLSANVLQQIFLKNSRFLKNWINNEIYKHLQKIMLHCLSILGVFSDFTHLLEATDCDIRNTS